MKTILYLILVVGSCGAAYAQSSGWQKLDLGASQYNDIFFLNGHEGWLTARFPQGVSRIMHTTDVGLHWNQVGPDRMWDTTGNLADSSYYTIYFYDSLRGFVVAGFDEDHLRDIVLETSDAGSTWTHSTAGIVNTRQFLMLADGRIAAIGKSDISLTKDSGRRWVDLNLGDGISNFNSIASYDGIHVMAVGDAGTWRDTVPPYNLYKKALFFLSSNGGVRWMESSTLFSKGIDAVVALDSEEFVLFTDSLMFKTTNFGADWTPYETGAGQAIFAAAFPSRALGFAVGSNGTIIQTANGGGTWSRQVSNSGSQLNKVVMLNDSVGFIIGWSGTLLITTSGGRSSAVLIPSSPNDGIQIFPQPSREYATIRLMSQSQRLRFTLFTIGGHQELSLIPTITTNGEHNEFSVPTASLRTGTYAYLLSVGSSTFTGHIAVLH